MPAHDFGLDFWNDPTRWDGIADPRRQMFWMKVHYQAADRVKQRVKRAIERERL